MTRTYKLAAPPAAAPTAQPPQSRLDLARELNDEQRAAVTAPDGPVLVLAGAGSGKTRALTYRLAYLLERGVPASQILLLTFTNKAARTMLSRAAALAGLDPRALAGGTFHHVGHLILRRHARLIGYGDNFSLLDREDARDLVGSCVADCEIDVTKARFAGKDVLFEIYTKAVNTARPIHQVVSEEFSAFISATDDITLVLRRYVSKKLALSVMDFDDLLLEWRRLFVEHPDVAEAYAARFSHVLVDEYQDTNLLQGELCDRLSAASENLFAVGDDAQSIYGFRGARIENILNFCETHPGCRIFKIEQNYRSRPEILALANRVLHSARIGYDKTLHGVREPGMRPALVVARDAEQQASFVAQRILELRDEGVPLNEICVLYRAHFHAMELQIELGRRNIPYVIRSGVRFFESAHVKDVLAYLRAVYNPQDTLALVRVLRLVEGIGQVSAERLAAALSERLVHGRASARGWGDEPSIEDLVPRRAKPGFVRFLQLLNALAEPALQATPAAMIDQVLAHYGDYLDTHLTSAALRREDLRQLADYAAQHAALGDFLQEIMLMNELSGEQVVGGDKSDEAVMLSSVHQAKGLEWQAVFVLWLADGKFPSQQSLGAFAAEEEERRLFYVAVTRAKDELYLSYPLVYRDRQRRQVILRPSRFLREIEAGGAGSSGAPPRVEPWERWQLEEAPAALAALGGPLYAPNQDSEKDDP